MSQNLGNTNFAKKKNFQNTYVWSNIIWESLGQTYLCHFWVIPTRLQRVCGGTSSVRRWNNGDG